MNRSGRGPRRRFGRVLPVLAALLLAAGCTSDGGPGSAPRVRLDHSTAVPAAPLADTGPVPGSVTESWRVDIPLAVDRFRSREIEKSPRLLNGQLVVASSHGLDVYDAATGKERWHYHEPGRELGGYAATAGVLVAMTQQPDSEDKSSSRRVGLDAGTGRVLWTSRDKGVRFTSDADSEVVAGGGVVPMRKREFADGLFGVDARSGRIRWTRERVGKKGCETSDITNQGNDGSLLLFRETCHYRNRILALDPATGRVRWRKEIVQQPNEEVSRASVSGGIALITYMTGFRLFAADGHELAGKSDLGCAVWCRLQTTAGYAVVAPMIEDIEGSEKHQGLIVDTRTGRATVYPVNESYSALTAAGGRVYGLHQHVSASISTELLPSGLDVIAPATGVVQPRPLPFATTRYSDVQPGEPTADWMAVAGGRLYTERLLGETVRVTSYTTTRPGGPAELGGVREKDWPDACRLAPGFELGINSKAADRSATIGSTTLRSVLCDFNTDDGFGTVETAWVAASPEQAHALLTMPTPARKAHVDGADEAYSLNDSEDLWIRVGRYVVRVKGFHTKDRIQLASAVAQELRKR